MIRNEFNRKVEKVGIKLSLEQRKLILGHPIHIHKELADRAGVDYSVRGATPLRFEDEIVEMKLGAFMNITAHRRHRVEWTTTDEPTFCLAAYYGV